MQLDALAIDTRSPGSTASVPLTHVTTAALRSQANNRRPASSASRRAKNTLSATASTGVSLALTVSSIGEELPSGYTSAVDLDGTLGETIEGPLVVDTPVAGTLATVKRDLGRPASASKEGAKTGPTDSTAAVDHPTANCEANPVDPINAESLQEVKRLLSQKHLEMAHARVDAERAEQERRDLQRQLLKEKRKKRSSAAKRDKSADGAALTHRPVSAVDETLGDVSSSTSPSRARGKDHPKEASSFESRLSSLKAAADRRKQRQAVPQSALGPNERAGATTAPVTSSRDKKLAGETHSRAAQGAMDVGSELTEGGTLKTEKLGFEPVEEDSAVVNSSPPAPESSSARMERLLMFLDKVWRDLKE